jgi:hypothetical protein
MTSLPFAPGVAAVSKYDRVGFSGMASQMGPELQHILNGESDGRDARWWLGLVVCRVGHRLNIEYIQSGSECDEE